MVGKLFGIMPRSVQAARQRKKFSVEAVMYVIWLVDMVFPCGSVPESRSRMAPSNSMSSLLAVRIFVVTGVRSVVASPSWEMRFSPARQL